MGARRERGQRLRALRPLLGLADTWVLPFPHRGCGRRGRGRRSSPTSNDVREIPWNRRRRVYFGKQTGNGWGRGWRPEPPPPGASRGAGPPRTPPNPSRDSPTDGGAAAAAAGARPGREGEGVGNGNSNHAPQPPRGPPQKPTNPQKPPVRPHPLPAPHGSPPTMVPTVLEGLCLPSPNFWVPRRVLGVSVLWKILCVPVSLGRVTDTRDCRVWGSPGGLEGSGGVGDPRGVSGCGGPTPVPAELSQFIQSNCKSAQRAPGAAPGCGRQALGGPGGTQDVGAVPWSWWGFSIQWHLGVWGAPGGFRYSGGSQGGAPWVLGRTRRAPKV